MRLSTSLSRYVARAVLGQGAVGLAVVAVVFVARNLFRTLAHLSGSGAGWSDLATVVGCVAAASLAYALPIGFLFGVLAGIGRLAADREVLALRSVGIGPRQLVVPVVALGILVSAVDALLVLELEPRAKGELRALLRARVGPEARLEPGRFTRLGSRTLWFGERQGARLVPVVLADRSRPDRPLWVFAEGAELVRAADGARRLRFLRGDVHEPGETRRRLAFATLELALDDGGPRGGRFAPRPKDLGAAELWAGLERMRDAPARAKDRLAYRVQLERRLALPAAPLLFAFVAVALAVRRRRGARSFALVACVALVVGYYALLSAGETLALAGELPVRALWLPNFALGAAGLWLLRRSRDAA